MAKRSQKRSVRYEKDQSGCMWGFISIFDFRHGRSTRKLLSDRKRGSKTTVGTVYSKNKFDMLRNLDEDCQGTLDGGENKIATLKSDADKPSVKKLIEEEMFNDQDVKKEIIIAEVESRQPTLGHEGPFKKDGKQTKKSRKKSHDMDSHHFDSDAILTTEVSSNQHSRKPSINDLDVDKIMEEFYHQIHLKTTAVEPDLDDEIHMELNRKHANIEEHVREAIKYLMNQKLSYEKDPAEVGKFHCSNELINALQIISSDKELYVKLLQDPNSLLMRYVQELLDAHEAKAKEYRSVSDTNSSEQKISNLKQTKEIVNCKQRHFFRKKVKSEEKTPSKENESSEASNRIVILKPGPTASRISETESSLGPSPDSHDIMRYKGPSERVGSHFFLNEIKRKLKHAMGKERHGISESSSTGLPFDHPKMRDYGKIIKKEAFGRKSPTKDHYLTEKITRPSIDVKRGNKTDRLKDSKMIVENEIGNCPKQSVSDIYIEAKRHLCEMLHNGDEDVDISSRQVPKTLGRILSLPEYNFSPIGSPGKDWEHGFVTAQTRLSTYDKFRKVNENVCSPKQATNINHLDQATQNAKCQSGVCDETLDSEGQALNQKPNFSDDQIHDNNVKETSYSVEDEIMPEGEVEIIKEIDVLDAPCEPRMSSFAENNQSCDISGISVVKRHSECLNEDISEESQLPSSPLSSPSRSPVSKKVEQLESATDISGRPSPVSVLVPPFTDDDISPAKTTSRAVEVELQPLRIRFEDDSSPADKVNCGKHCIEEKELIFDYVKAVLQASCLNWEQLWMKCLSSDQILDPSMFDQVEFSNQLCHDQKLLFDCINEVLFEVCYHYFGVSPWVSFVKPSIRAIPNMKKAILEVWEGVWWHLLPLPLPHTLDQIVKKDMTRNVGWMDLRFDAETVGTEMEEAILADLMEDTILSCLSESSDSKSGYPALQF